MTTGLTKERVAYHEAAHILTAWVLDQIPLSVFVYEDSDLDYFFNNGLENNLGLASMHHDDDETTFVLICLAGYAAESG
jgi:hypothetical protein